MTLPLFFALLPACSDFGLTPMKDTADPTFDPAVDSADDALGNSAEVTLMDTAAPDAEPDGDPAADPEAEADAEPEPEPCGTFTFAWTAPFDGVIELAGEFTTADGTVVAGWTELATAEGRTATASVSACEAVYFRGEGIWSPSATAEATTWSCVRQSMAEADYALVGEVSFTLDGAELPVDIVDAPTSDGCEVGTWVE